MLAPWSMEKKHRDALNAELDAPDPRELVLLRAQREREAAGAPRQERAGADFLAAMHGGMRT